MWIVELLWVQMLAVALNNCRFISVDLSLVTEALRCDLKWATALWRNKNLQIKEEVNPEGRKGSSNAVITRVCERLCCVLPEIPSSHFKEMEAGRTTQPTEGKRFHRSCRCVASTCLALVSLLVLAHLVFTSACFLQCYESIRLLVLLWRP